MSIEKLQLFSPPQLFERMTPLSITLCARRPMQVQTRLCYTARSTWFPWQRITGRLDSTAWTGCDDREK